VSSERSPGGDRSGGFRVSALIPAYNEVSRIAVAIASARAQSEPPAEILVIDDGSTDGTAAVATELGARVIVQANAGIARTRNRLVREAAHPWLAFLDADDVWYPEKLETVRRAIESAPGVRFITSDLRCRFESGTLAKTSVFETTPHYRDAPKTTIADGVVRLSGSALGVALATGNFIGTSTVVVDRDLAHATPFDETLRADADAFVAEDVEWYLRVLAASDALAIARPLGEYTWRTASLASDYGRVRYGDVKLGERVAADPASYVDGAAAAFVRERRGTLRHVARIFARRRDFARARAALAEAQRDGFHPVDAAAMAALAIATAFERRP
jgi:glycosyltransferase involved in cell wall biosynthesis